MFQIKDSVQIVKLTLEYIACSPYLLRIVLIPQCG